MTQATLHVYTLSYIMNTNNQTLLHKLSLQFVQTAMMLKKVFSVLFVRQWTLLAMKTLCTPASFGRRLVTATE